MQKKGTVPNRSLANAVQKIKYLSMLLRANRIDAADSARMDVRHVKPQAWNASFQKVKREGIFGL